MKTKMFFLLDFLLFFSSQVKYTRSLVVFLLLSAALFSSVEEEELSQERRLKVNLISDGYNGKGLQTDVLVLKEALEQLGCRVSVIDIEEPSWSRGHINLFIQGVNPSLFAMAHQNWFIPNPEWFQAPAHLLYHFDLILCRTKEVERIFRSMDLPLYYLGFTSPDYWDALVSKNYHSFCHLAGGSLLKGTEAIKECWARHPALPPLLLVQFSQEKSCRAPNITCISRCLPQDEFRLIQNRCGIHLCPSEVEGFGHYLMEALSTKAVVVTTDAPPMNEFIQDPRCLIPYRASEPLLLARRYFIDEKKLHQKVKQLLKLSVQELQEIGEANRLFYLAEKEAFLQRLQELIETLSPLKEIPIKIEEPCILKSSP